MGLVFFMAISKDGVKPCNFLWQILWKATIPMDFLLVPCGFAPGARLRTWKGAIGWIQPEYLGLFFWDLLRASEPCLYRALQTSLLVVKPWLALQKTNI